LGLSRDAKIKDGPSTSASAVIGLTGEQEVFDLLSSKYEILNTAKTGKCADFIIVVGGVRILIEVKKYSKTIPSLEVAKFKRDIEANASQSAAIMISLTSKIVGMGNSAVTYEHHNVTGRDVPVAYLNLTGQPTSLSKNTICAIVDVLMADIKSRASYIDVADSILATINTIGVNLDCLSQCRLVVNETQSIMNKQFGKISQQIITAEVCIRNAVLCLKDKVDVHELLDCADAKCVRTVASTAGLSPEMTNIVLLLVEHVKEPLSVSKTTLVTEDKKLSIAMKKTSVKVSVVMSMEKTITCHGKWTYNGKSITISLAPDTLECILGIVNDKYA
jgi:hypothetical protein